VQDGTRDQEADIEHPARENLSHANETETRPQQAGEGGTTRFGMEDGDNTDIPTTGTPEAEQNAADPAS
jgi:hypothetical protein